MMITRCLTVIDGTLQVYQIARGCEWGQ